MTALTFDKQLGQPSDKSLFSVEAILKAILAFCFALGCLAALVVLIVILSGSMQALKEVPILRFLTDSNWHPTTDLYNLKPMIVGSLVTSIGALILAMPVALGIAAATNFFLSPFLAGFTRRLLFVMASMPTVIFGFWGLTKVVPLIGSINAPGVSLASGIFVLFLMILPTTALLIDMAVAKIPKQLVHGAYALGAKTYQICFLMAFKVVRAALVSAALLGLGRALGETIVVVMVTGNKAAIPGGLFDPVRTLTANVALEMGYASPLHGSALCLSILLLFVIASGLAFGVHYIDTMRESTRVDV